MGSGVRWRNENGAGKYEGKAGLGDQGGLPYGVRHDRLGGLSRRERFLPSHHARLVVPLGEEHVQRVVAYQLQTTKICADFLELSYHALQRRATLEVQHFTCVPTHAEPW